MSSVREPESGHRDFYHDMKKSSRSHYTTALSVIQGVALADLASVVAAGYRANEEDEKKELLNFLYRRFLEFSTSCLVFSAILIVLAIISHVNHLEPSEGVLGVRGVLVLGILLFIAGCIVVWEILSARSWSTIMNHYRPGIQAEVRAE